MKKIPQDILGNIAILKFPRRTLWFVKKFRALQFLREHKKVTTVVEKIGSFSGRLRVLKTKYLVGVKTTIVNYRENGCEFEFDINGSYFSPRLSNERKVIADEVVRLVGKKKRVRILVMFAGVAPYSITIAKKLKKSEGSAIIFSNELNREANFFAAKNIKLNKLENDISIIPGDAKKIYKKVDCKFDIILMPRPNLKDTFLESALALSKRGSVIFYHGFGTRESVLGEIDRDVGGRIGRVSIRKAGDIGVNKYRWQAVFRVK